MHTTLWSKVISKISHHEIPPLIHSYGAEFTHDC
jgi:hypothetical protein